MHGRIIAAFSFGESLTGDSSVKKIKKLRIFFI
jgi:hypothetical protein